MYKLQYLIWPLAIELILSVYSAKYVEKSYIGETDEYVHIAGYIISVNPAMTRIWFLTGSNRPLRCVFVARPMCRNQLHTQELN